MPSVPLRPSCGIFDGYILQQLARCPAVDEDMIIHRDYCIPGIRLREGLRLCAIGQGDLVWHRQACPHRPRHPGDNQRDDGYDTDDHGQSQHNDQPLQKPK